MSKSEDERQRTAVERLRERIAAENKRRPTGGEVLGPDGRPIGRRGVQLTTREIERAAASLLSRNEAQTKADRHKPTPSTRPAVDANKIREAVDPEAIRESVLKMDKDEHREE